jgi:hypothetical protein
MQNKGSGILELWKREEVGVLELMDKDSDRVDKKPEVKIVS